MADVELGVQKIAGMQHAGGGDGAAHGVGGLEGEITPQVVDAAPAGQRRGQFDPGGDGVDLDRHRPPLGLAGAREKGPTVHAHRSRPRLVHFRAAIQERGRVPAHGKVADVEPHALPIGDGQTAQGESRPRIAAQALDGEMTHPAELHAIGLPLNERPTLGGSGKEAHKGRRAEGQCRQPGQSDQQPSAEPSAAARRGSGFSARLLRRAHQKAWPMLMYT